MNRSLARNAIVLGLLSAVGPFAIDMYLPALPSIAAEFKASDAATQGTLIAFFVAVAFGQIVYGPISDSLGRRAPLYFGMVLYSIGAIGCSLAPSIEWLIAARFVQGIGACAGMTIPRAIVRDLHTGPDAAQLMSLIMLVFSAAPILAPLFGSMVIALASWRVIFDVVSMVGIVGMAITFFALEETRPPEKRVPLDRRSVCARLSRAASRPHLRRHRPRRRFRHGEPVLVPGGLVLRLYRPFRPDPDPVQPRLLRQCDLLHRLGPVDQPAGAALRAEARRARLGHPLSGGAGLLFGATLAGLDNVYALIAMLLVSFGAMGPLGPATAVMALESHGTRAGTASALLGTLQLFVGMTVVSITGIGLQRHGAAHGERHLRLRAAAFLISLFALNGGEPVRDPQSSAWRLRGGTESR